MFHLSKIIITENDVPLKYFLDVKIKKIVMGFDSMELAPHMHPLWIAIGVNGICWHESGDRRRTRTAVYSMKKR